MDKGDFFFWLSRHLAIHPRRDWPEKGSAEFLDFFAVWRRAFFALRVSPAEATEASDHLAERGGEFPERHLGAILGRVRSRRHARLAESQAAERESRRRKAEEIMARDAELFARWDRLPEAERARIEAEVQASRPEWARWTPFLRAACIRHAFGEDPFCPVPLDELPEVAEPIDKATF